MHIFRCHDDGRDLARTVNGERHPLALPQPSRLGLACAPNSQAHSAGGALRRSVTGLEQRLQPQDLKLNVRESIIDAGACPNHSTGLDHESSRDLINGWCESSKVGVNFVTGHEPQFIYTPKKA